MTPVRTSLPRQIVTWPTFTPGTSVIALSSPVSSTPGARPRSRARGRDVASGWAERFTAKLIVKIVRWISMGYSEGAGVSRGTVKAIFFDT